MSIRYKDGAVRFIAILNLVLVAGGVIPTLRYVPRLRSAQFPAELLNGSPYFWQFVTAFLAMNVVFLITLTLSSILLWKRHPAATKLVGGVLVAELLYELALLALFAVTQDDSPVGLSAAAALGVGNGALGLQLLVGYPVTGLIAIVWISRFGLSAPAAIGVTQRIATQDTLRALRHNVGSLGSAESPTLRHRLRPLPAKNEKTRQPDHCGQNRVNRRLLFFHSPNRSSFSARHPQTRQRARS